jgi:acetoin utilization deacetylase AcuC-like enzyme
MIDRAGGFCIFNNIGITARYAMKKYGMRRILIVDWDVHHGNGLNDLFYNESEVLYMSTHDNLIYPYTGNWEEAGRGAGEGYTINIPITRDLEDDDFYVIYQSVLPPLITGYSPELILVAAGFDAHRDDPIGKCRLTERAFGLLAKLLLKLCLDINKIPLLLVLEGGYDPRSLARSVREVLIVLTGRDSPEAYPVTASQRAEKLIDKARQVQRSYHANGQVFFQILVSIWEIDYLSFFHPVPRSICQCLPAAGWVSYFVRYILR